MCVSSTFYTYGIKIFSDDISILNLKAINEAKGKKEDSIRKAQEQSTSDIEEKVNIYNYESSQAEETLKKDVVYLARMISDKFIETNEEIEPELIDKIMQG